MKKNKLDPRSLILGMAAGAGAALAGNYLLNRDPDKRFDQRRVNRVMDGHWREAHQQGPIQLGSEHRYIIFSDHHKGARTRADAFKQCEQTYLAALDHYYEQGFTLILLGDAEELLEESIERVLSSYENVLRSEARFHPSRLMRIFGNHDLHWQVEELVQEFMEPYYPGIYYRQSIIFEYRDGEANFGGNLPDPRASGHAGERYLFIRRQDGPALLPEYPDTYRIRLLHDPRPRRLPAFSP